ncbi:MAG: O-antigen ligase family protein [Saprospiraceae bacterium]
MALLTMLYFIACHAFNSLKAIKQTIWLILILLTAAGLYGLKQEFIGFSAAEESWIYADTLRFQLLFQWTRMRIFSVLNDPTTFGIMMAYGAVFCTTMLIGPFSNPKKILFGLGAVIMFWVMAYTGTRTAYALVPIGLIMFVALTLRKKILLLGFFGLILGVGAMMKSTSNPLIYRIQSAFKVTEDESMQVRFENQKLIQPFIQKHPIGAGLGSTGVWGKRFTPNSWLANFPHDSGFVRIAVEQGWIGLIIYLGLLFVALQKAIYYYVRVKNPEIKILYLGIFLVLFMLSVASYPQEIIVHLPSSLIFYIFLAAIVRLKDFDPNFATTHETIHDKQSET